MDRTSQVLQCICLLSIVGLLLVVAWAVGVRLEEFARRLDRVESSITASGKAVKVIDELKKRGLVIDREAASRAIENGGK